MVLKRFLPRSLYGRAALILIVPIVAIQLVVSTAFIQRHFEGVTRQMTQGVALDLALVLAEFSGPPAGGAASGDARRDGANAASGADGGDGIPSAGAASGASPADGANDATAASAASDAPAADAASGARPAEAAGIDAANGDALAGAANGSTPAGAASGAPPAEAANNATAADPASGAPLGDAANGPPPAHAANDAPARAEAALRRAGAIAQPLQIGLVFPAGPTAPVADQRVFYDVAGGAIVDTLHQAIPALRAVDVTAEDRLVRIRIATPHGDLLAEIARRRMSATNPHQLLVLMIFTSVLMTLIAYLFLRNQLRPIQRLAQAAESFGRGERTSYRPRGATEVRAAGRAFLEMRARIERQIEQRTLMLSGVSHDLRTPLTRMKLGLSFLPEDEETEGLKQDLIQMERLVDEFLSFVRGDATEDDVDSDPAALVEAAVADALRGGGAVRMLPVAGRARRVQLRPQALRRALDNLIGNALRHGSRADVTVIFRADRVILRVEDDGPGIPESRRDEALRPFTRLGAERDPNRGGGVGLGLSIAADIALSHGGRLNLGQSPGLGGLKAEIELAR